MNAAQFFGYERAKRMVGIEDEYAPLHRFVAAGVLAGCFIRFVHLFTALVVSQAIVWILTV